MAGGNSYLNPTSDLTTRTLSQSLQELGFEQSTLLEPTTLDPSPASQAQSHGRQGSHTVVYAGKLLILPSASGYLEALPAEVFDLILSDIFIEAFQFTKSSDRAREALRGLAQTNIAMKHMVQLELTHFFGRWANERLKEGCSWANIADVYCWVRGRSLTWDV